jgi:hypothetical protein
MKPLYIILLLICRIHVIFSFTFNRVNLRNRVRDHNRQLSLLSVMGNSNQISLSSIRNTILKRNGRFFKLNRLTGRIEFGTTINLNTRLNTPESLRSLSPISQWLANPKEVAMSIWKKSMITELKNSADAYRLELMTLQFVTIQLAPTVDTRMWTEKTQNGSPIFMLQSFQFNPNIQILPGVGISSKDLEIEINVVGELRQNTDLSGVEGKIGFVTAGVLPHPLRMLPDFVLEAAAETISQTTANFAVTNFQQGAQSRFREYINKNY